MDVQHKDATITNTSPVDEFPGSFEVILSAPTKDRDGDTLLPDEWKSPLPDHITFDADHGMSVATTVGSGVPRLDEKSGNLIVSGTYSSLGRAQEVRTLVNEGHIRTTSVAFMSEKSQAKDGKSTSVRELLNGAFVAIPSNREALVLSSKAAQATKAGSRNSKTDSAHLQAAHDSLVKAGAQCPMDDTGAAQGATGGKSVTAPVAAAAAPDDSDDDPGKLAQGVDAALDQALALLADVDLETLPTEVQQAIALLTAAEETSDELQDALGVPDPDEKSAADLAVRAQALTLQARAYDVE